MKIERISDNQIRCTLTKNDLLERELKISELAYGSDKAKELFRDMMEQANIDFGFEADDIPLMIEAIPTSKDSIVLVITKVDNQEEFDEKFSRFGIHEEDVDDFEPFNDMDEDMHSSSEDEDTESPDIINCFEQLNELIEANGGTRPDEFIPFSEAIKGKKKKKEQKKKKKQELQDKVRVFSFDSMNPIIHVAHGVTGYAGKNSLWKNEATHRYFLLLNCGHSAPDFHSTCATLSEYGKEELATYASEAFFNEHYTLIIKDKALSRLSLL